MQAIEVKETFVVGLDTALPEELRVGKGNALFISGWCFHTTRKIKKLEIIIGNKVHPVKITRWARRDILDKNFSTVDPNGNSYQSGFWTTVVWYHLNETIKTDFQLKATLNDGSECTQTIGTITLKPEA